MLAKASRHNWDTCARRGQEATNACRVHGTARRCPGQGVPRANTRPGEGNGVPDTVTQRRGSPAGPLGGRRRKAGQPRWSRVPRVERNTAQQPCSSMSAGAQGRLFSPACRPVPLLAEQETIVVADTTACRRFCVNRSSPLFKSAPVRNGENQLGDPRGKTGLSLGDGVRSL
uniref:Uncharacterized protein n=1 Tax=Ixodes scapularis TaxID=6945 RepID=A0A1S4L090_IXOSC